MDNWGKEKRKVNPREEANFLSLLTFGYTLRIFRKGLRKDLEADDLYEVIESCRSQKCGYKTEVRWSKAQSIYKLLWKRFGKRYVVLALVTIAWTQMHSILQPYGMSRLISYFDKSQTHITRTDAYYSAGIVVFLNVSSFLFWQNFHIFELNFAVKVQTSLKSLLYRKILRLSPESLSSTNLGNIVTILTKDIYTIEVSSWLVMDIVIFAAKTITVSYLLWAKLGNTAFIGIGLVLLALPVQTYISSFLTKMRLKVGKKADERLQVMQETLSAIKIIKMYTWECFFNKRISDARSKEILVMMKAFYLTIVIISIGVITSKITFLILIMSYIWMGYTTNTELLFYVLSLFSDLSTSLGVLIPANICRIAEFKASFIRLNALLQAKELDDDKDKDGNAKSSKKLENMIKVIDDNIVLKAKEREIDEKKIVINAKPSIELDNVVVRIKDIEILKNIKLSIMNSGLTIVTGAVGSGKSSLLKVMLKDYSISKGNMRVSGTVSYASQEPWLFPSSVKQNILFGEEFEASRYEEVVRVCALKYDLSLLDNGDETIVADRGLNLSKGQQLRINLARAIYKKSDIYLIDDALTALDGHVQEYIFEEAIKKMLSDKICILVTQNPSHLKKADDIIVMKRGKIAFIGKPDDKINGLLEKSEETQAKSNAEKPKTKENDPSLLETEQQFSKKKVYQEVQKTGKVELTVYKMYIKYGGGFLVASLIATLYILAQVCASSSDKLITQWIDLQQEVLDLQENSTVNGTEYDETVSRKDTTFTMYAVMVILNSALNLVKYYALLRFCRSASINIHQAMSSRVVTAVMSFFDTHFIGNILNRFSYDLNNIDEHIPLLFPGLFTVIFSCIGGTVLVASINWIFLIPACVFLVTMILIRTVYIPTGRSLKRLAAAAKSPLVGHINSTLEGLTTIRAFKAEPILTDEFDRHQDLYSSAKLTHFYTSTAFGFYMDFFSSVFTMLVIARFLFFEHDFSAGKVGLALTQVFMLTTSIQWAIKQWASLENHMTSVERALEYTTIQPESSIGETISDWPKDGSIVYENVTLKYEKSRDPVLKSISFSVEPGQKIGIVGRTGAGKSSILSTLFRLYEYEGKITIDDVDISTLSLPFLRKNIAIIPQDPILFTGTIRSNIDPNKKYTDAAIWKAIERVKVKHLIPSLDMEVTESGSHFSVGQKQLICLARAAIDRYKVVVLDEATANMDAVTDKMLHDVIEDIFSKCTMFMIAHRLHTVLNCDKVMVLDSGTIVEFENPRTLLQNKNSHFYSMCQTADLES